MLHCDQRGFYSRRLSLPAKEGKGFKNGLDIYAAISVTLQQVFQALGSLHVTCFRKLVSQCRYVPLLLFARQVARGFSGLAPQDG